MPNTNPVINMQWLNRAYQWAVQTCNAPNIGYSQDYRNQQTVNGITYYDCSSFVWYALYNGGFDKSLLGFYPFVTYNYSEPVVLTNLGFTKLNANAVKWLPGDILLGRWGTWKGVTDYQHTEMVYKGTNNVGEGYTMGAHGANGRVLADQVSINTTLSYASTYPVLYRYGQGGAEGYGLTMEQVAGLCGNAWMESTVNPASEGFSVPEDHARGLWSWTDWTGTNPFYAGTAMMNWMTDKGYSTWKDGDGQVACMIADDLPQPFPHSMWTNTSIPEYTYTNALYPDMQSFLEDNTITVEEATREFFLHWESPTSLYWFNYTWSQRLAFAQEAYEYIQAHANDTSITEWIVKDPPNHYLTKPEALNNCVMMYRIASAGGGGGGRKTDRYKMPLYMMLRRRRW